MDWKIIAALVVAVAIVVSGFFASGGINLTGAPAPSPSGTGSNPLADFFSGVKNTVSNILPISEKNISRNLEVSGSFAMLDSVLSLNTPAASVDMESDIPASMFVGSERINFSDGANISVGNFLGRIDIYANGTITVDGNAETVYVSNVGILPHAQKTVPVKTVAQAKTAKIYNASADNLLVNATGIISIGQGKIMLKTDAELLQMQNYRGTFDISGKTISIEGLSTKVLLNGKEKVSVG